MTGLLVRLHRTLWWRSMRGNSAAAIMGVLIFLYAVIGMVSLFITIMMLDPADRAWAMVGTVGLGTFSYLVVTVLIPSGESQISPAEFASLPVTARDLVPAMAWAALLNSRGILAALVTLVSTVFAVWQFGPGWIPGMVLSLVLTLLLGEVIRVFSAGSGRASRERLNVLSGVLVMGMIFGFNLLMSYGVENIPLDVIGRVLGWTPVAAAAGTTAALFDATFLTALGMLAVAAATLALGVWFWHSTIARRLTAPLDAVTPEENRREESALLLPGLPDTPGAMIYSRALRYFRRDPRLLGSLAVFPILALFIVVQGTTVDELNLFLGVIVLSLISGSIASNDLGYDGPASWVHIAAGVPARTLLLARHLAQLTPTLVLLFVIQVLTLVLARSHGLAVLVVIASFGIVISVAGLALVLSTHNPYPTAKPGTNPWADKSGFSGAAFVAAFGSLLVGWLPVAPGAGLLIYGHLAGQWWAIALGVVLVLGLPALVYWLCLRASVRRVETGMPEIYARVARWAN